MGFKKHKLLSKIKDRNAYVEFFCKNLFVLFEPTKVGKRPVSVSIDRAGSQYWF